jgi:hypothetical protein
LITQAPGFFLDIKAKWLSDFLSSSLNSTGFFQPRSKHDISFSQKDWVMSPQFFEYFDKKMALYSN